MDMQRGMVSIATCGLILVSTSATRFAAAAPAAACTFLTPADASKALEVQALAGKEEGMGPTGCIWWGGAATDSSRRVALNTHEISAFGIAKKPFSPAIKIEPVSGIGEEAFYELYPKNAPPFLWFRKGDVAISIRIITRTDPRPFTIDQEKAKEAVLAKAAVAKL